MFHSFPKTNDDDEHSFSGKLETLGLVMVERKKITKENNKRQENASSAMQCGAAGTFGWLAVEMMIPAPRMMDEWRTDRKKGKQIARGLGPALMPG